MRAVFLGTPEFSRTVLAGMLDVGWDIPLVVTQPDRARQRRGRGEAEASPVGEFATAKGLAVRKPARIAEVSDELDQAKPDAFVVASYGQIIPEAVLKLGGGRWVNVHASLLPEYRGASPIQQAIADGKTMTGVTLMEVVPALDAGAIIATHAVPVTDTDTADTLEAKLAEAGAELLVKTLPEYVAGAMRPTPQDNRRVTMTHQLAKADGRIDWSQDADSIERFVRAMQPWPGAWTEIDGTPVTITAAQPEATPSAEEPGTFTENVPLRVGTGDGSLAISRIIPAGKAEMDAADWLRGRRRGGRFA